MKKYDVAVIGAGVVGGMIARELSRYKLNTVIIEKEADVAMGATRANSAIVHAGFDAKEGSLKAKLNVQGSEMMAEVAHELGVKYLNNGAFVVAFTEEENEAVKDLLVRGQKNGVKGLEIIDGDELRRREPAISKDAISALWAPTSAIICPYELAISAIGNAMDNGVELLTDTPVTSLEKKGDAWIINGEIEAGTVINAAGVYSGEIAALAGDKSIEITPRRGEYLLCDRESGDFVNATIFRTPSSMGKGILISPTVDHNLILGPTAENIDDKDDRRTTREGLAKVAKEATYETVNLPIRKVITSFTGLRAVGNTGDFIINEPISGFINAAGIESPGLSSAPAIAKYIVEIIKKTRTLEKNENFNPIRPASHAFREMSMEEKNEVIKRDPRYGQIVCRCEKITEGEIVAAINQNPKAKTVDAVKRRTRATMGRCQGGFCMPIIASIISRELEIDIEEVTKSGKGSEIVVSKTK
ncbi:MAG: NAD(P)/FAD-dependent oxidoreductase [Ruminococcaceae bacterium]|nr:NAD(P)/FAD-dependent oxidoreductase [Oscillospiraceae bacterium]